MQDTVGSTIAFAAIVHLGATVPPRLLRCILNSEDMVTVSTADFDCYRPTGGILAPDSPGLGIVVDEAALGEPIMTWTT